MASSLFTDKNLTSHQALEQIGLELAAVAITAVIAGTGPKAAHAMVALWLLLWALYLITKYAK
jgi:hypothetical protein